MRILAIRGRNLASLAGDFEMRLDAPPLADAGLFAITGRTGSGKSSILDALCLALFDRMPRLPAGRGTEVGRADDAPESRLRNNDVRSVLRRGTGEGYAEVDFRGVDGCRYRARWSARRARERANGRFQAQTMELGELDSGDDLGGTKTEVLDAIQARLGLTFDQFRRSVLLAQGDFAAFLQAGPSERAELLERITGTGIYGEISRAAHRRAVEEQRELDLVRQRLGDQRPLDEQEREDLQGELAAAQHDRDELLATQSALQQAQHWYQTLNKLVAEREQAARQLAAAASEQAAAEPRRQVFERVCDLQPLRLHLTAVDRADEALSRAQRDLERSLGEERDRQTAAERAAKKAENAEVGLKGAEKAETDAIPALKAARKLDAEVQIARGQLKGATAEYESMRQTLAEAQSEEDELNARSAQAAETLRQAEDWLAAHAGAEPLALQWEAWARDLDRYVQACGALEDARAAIEAAEERGAKLALQRRDLENTIARFGAERAQALNERAELEARSADFNLNRLAALRAERLERRDKLAQWRQLAEQAGESRRRLEGTGNTLAAEQSRHAKCEARLREIDAEIGPHRAAFTEAEEAHRRMLLASAGEVQTLRSQLWDGEPCPVCGARKHPWAHRVASAFEDLVGKQAARVEDLKRRSEELTAEKARNRAELDQAERRGAELASELDAQQALLDRTLDAWSACEADTLRPPDPFQDGLVTRQADGLEALIRSLHRIDGDEGKARSLQSQVKAKIAEIEGLDARLVESQKQIEDLNQQIRAVADALAREDGERTRAEATMGQVLGLIADPFAGIDDWRNRLQVDPVTFVDACRCEVDAWRQRVDVREAARQSHHELAPRLARARARRQGFADTLAQRSAALEKQSEAQVVLARERAEVLDDRPADLVEAELNARVALARQSWEQSRSDLAEAREALKTAQGVVATRRQALQERRAATVEARQALDERMAGQGVVLDELRGALKRDQDWIERERLSLQVLRDTVGCLEGLVKERERRVVEHRTVEPPELSQDAVSQGLPLAAESLKTAQERWGQLHGRLGEDNRRREASKEIQAELERQQAAWELWESLRGLIGSADGGKFRNFAQGLTLDLLVAHANRHLQDLARRYELQRVPGSEMEIQVVDREMGDEVRGIHSLSGGESFLASLALALGLASLASDRVEVESLFIDEGFGSLDADSLDLAIASLDALYSLGRQVGVISHVGTLVERIGVKVQVTKQGAGRSRLEVVAD